MMEAVVTAAFVVGLGLAGVAIAILAAFYLHHWLSGILDCFRREYPPILAGSRLPAGNSLSSRAAVRQYPGNFSNEGR